MNEYKPDNLIADTTLPLSTDLVVIKSGEDLKRGAVLGVDGNGKYLLSQKASTDGSQTPIRILGEDVNAQGADKSAIVYKMGAFNANALILGTGHTIESIKPILWEKSNIDIKTAIKG